MQKCQCYYTLSDQSIPLVTHMSVFSLLTEQLCSLLLMLSLISIKELTKMESTLVYLILTLLCIWRSSTRSCRVGRIISIGKGHLFLICHQKLILNWIFCRNFVRCPKGYQILPPLIQWISHFVVRMQKNPKKQWSIL